MIKWTILAKAKADIHEQRFYYHWRMIHAPLALQMRDMRRYVQNHCIEPAVWEIPSAAIHGVVECWFDDLDSALQTLAGPDYLDHARLDEPNLGDPAGSSVFFMTEHVVKRASVAELDGAVKAMLFLNRAEQRPLGRGDIDATIASLETLGDRFSTIELSVPLPEHQHGKPYHAMVSLGLPSPQALATVDKLEPLVRAALVPHFDLDRSTSFLAEPYVIRGESGSREDGARKPFAS